MAEREHFTNGRCLTFGTGLALTLAALTLQVSGWQHWLTIGAGYGTGAILMLQSCIWITRSYYSRHTVVPVPSVELAPTALQTNSLSELFAPLQVEVLHLAKDIRVFLKDFEPIPELIDPLSGATEKQRRSRINERSAWRERLKNAYQLRFGDRTKTAELKLGEQNLSISSGIIRENPLATEQYIALYADTLIAMAHRLDGVVLEARTR